MKLTVILEKTSTGYSAYCKEIDGMTTVGKTSADIKENFQELIQMRADYLDEQGKEKEANEMSKAKFEFVFEKEIYKKTNLTGKHVVCKDVDFLDFEKDKNGLVKIYDTLDKAIESTVDNDYPSTLILQVVGCGFSKVEGEEEPDESNSISVDLQDENLSFTEAIVKYGKPID